MIYDFYFVFLVSSVSVLKEINGVKEKIKNNKNVMLVYSFIIVYRFL